MLLYSNPKLKFDKYSKAFSEAMDRVIRQEQFILGKEVSQFEDAFANYLSAKHCIGVNSGTDAITIALDALDLSPGDEVITTALSAHGTVVAIERARLVPVIVDVVSPTHTIDPKEVEKAIGPKTKAILPVHLHGFPAALDELQKLCNQHNLHLVEDCAQAHGATYQGQKLGTFGELSTFSFYPTKNLGCMGDGGAVVTNRDEFKDRLLALRYYGLDNNDINKVGINSRLDEIQAAFLSIMLPHLDAHNAARFDYAQRYHQELSAFKEWLPPIIDGAVYHQFGIRVPNRDLFKQLMADKGIQLGEHYSFSMSNLSAFKSYCRATPVADQVSQKLVSLPIQPEILDDHFAFVVEIAHSCLKRM
ncbi:MAG: DegT/DnrJ/EryC1/StrS family aminotransferase [Bacteroidota bacterium]